MDYPLSLGAILLGHADQEITSKIAFRLGYGSIFTLPHQDETLLAEELHRLIPSAESMRFLKTGSEATSAAVRIARSYTKRSGVAFCGYHGWHDWCTVATPKNSGIPSELRDHIYKFEYNNIDSLKDIFRSTNGSIGCVILEPYIYDAPEDGFLKKVVEVAHRNGALVVFDEVVTGFRTKGYSAQKYYGVTPDLSCFGKAMGNGIPISVVCGKRKYMDELNKDCFVSSTFGGDLLGIYASLVVISRLGKTGIDKIWESGDRLKSGYNLIAENLGIDTKCVGHPCRTMFLFPSSEHKSLFWQECIIRGVLFGYAQFISLAHNKDVIDETLNVVDDALRIVKDNWSNPLKALKGKKAEEVFRLVVTRENNVK